MKIDLYNLICTFVLPLPPCGVLPLKGAENFKVIFLYYFSSLSNGSPEERGDGLEKYRKN
ncbi:MAG: hypothetical protein Q8S84_05160 [bacterium]|nr:hypothetical protein [bacterium]MDP3380882.1 hypothetical protein [bacterium]